MSKLSKFWKALRMVAGRPWLLNKITESDEEYGKKVFSKYGIRSFPVVDISQFLEKEFEISPYTFLDGTSSPVDLALLRSLAASIPNCRYLEIGTWRGESVANVAAVAKECVTINLSDEEMRNRGWDEKYILAHRVLSKNLPNVKHVNANSQTADLSGLGKFDLIFVDGDHHYSSVLSDTKKCLPLLRDKSSIMVWHDYAFAPLQPRAEVLLGILDGMPPSEHSCLYQPSHSMCCIYTSKPLPKQAFNPFPDDYKSFKISVEGRS